MAPLVYWLAGYCCKFCNENRRSNLLTGRGLDDKIASSLSASFGKCQSQQLNNVVVQVNVSLKVFKKHTLNVNFDILF